MEVAVVINIMSTQYDVLDCGYKGVEAEALPIVKFDLYEP